VSEDALGATLVSLRERLARGVVLTGERLQETVDDAVSRGRITRDDAEDLVQRLITGGRKQTEDLLADIESLLSRSRSELLTAGRRAGTQVRDSGAPDRVLREVDRARRVVGIGPTFPILGYDDLTAGQITTRLGDLNRSQLRKVRDYERRHANRKSVLDAIERGLQ
jgi:polyhydroxyalkanoate synthesis regulator phasin